MNALSSIRELFHSHSHFSSQHDCLDFIASLFFAHIASIEDGGEGISSAILREGGSTAKKLSAFINDTYDRHLTKHQKSSLDDRYRSVSLSKGENAFAESVIKEIQKTRDPIREAHAHGRDDVLNAIFSRFLCGSFIDEKEMGQYLTPPEIVHLMTSYGLSCLSAEKRRKLTSLSEVDSAGIILDPSCGVGSFLGTAAQILSDDVRPNLSPAEFQEWSEKILRNKIIGFEKSMRMAHLAITNLFLFGAGESRIHRLNSLLRSDEITNSVKGKCWLILTNPPFGAEYSGNEIADYEIAKDFGRNGRNLDSELLFIERYMEWLAPGGVLVSVVPDNLLTGQGIYADIRAYILKHSNLESVVSLPSVTFAAAGTSTKTSILTVRKKEEGSAVPNEAYFGVCNAVGFDVMTKGGYRRRKPTPENDLPVIAGELRRGSRAELGRWASLTPDAKRWDAIYHAHPSLNGNSVPLPSTAELPMVSDVSCLVDDRTHPKRLFRSVFPYVEISDIDAKTGWVKAKNVSVEKAPSRARKIVRCGDVLVSTVRPERGAVGVVPEALEGAICSTGLAVLRPSGINPHLLRRLLVSRFIVNQMERHNVGIAYPAISERDLMTFKLPLSERQMEDLAEIGRKVGEVLETASRRLADLDEALTQIGPELSR